MVQTGFSSSPGTAPPVPALRMDRLLSWLSNPAIRLAHMLRAMPGYDVVNHVGLSLHEAATDLLWVVSCSSPQDGVHEVEMKNVPALSLLVGAQEPRIIHDLAEFGSESRFLSTGAKMINCRSSMTAPLYQHGEFLGFVNFGARRPAFFDAEVCDMLAVYAEAFAILIMRGRDEVCA